jgi:hypothetical protein
MGGGAVANVPLRIFGEAHPADDDLRSGDRSARILPVGRGNDGRGARIRHGGKQQSCMLAAFATPRGRWIGLVVFGPETSVGLVQLFFDRMVEELVGAAPREPAAAPLLAENFERELNTSLKELFGR